MPSEQFSTDPHKTHIHTRSVNQSHKAQRPRKSPRLEFVQQGHLDELSVYMILCTKRSFELATAWKNARPGHDLEGLSSVLLDLLLHLTVPAGASQSLSQSLLVSCSQDGGSPLKVATAVSGWPFSTSSSWSGGPLPVPMLCLFRTGGQNSGQNWRGGPCILAGPPHTVMAHCDLCYCSLY